MLGLPTKFLFCACLLAVALQFSETEATKCGCKTCDDCDVCTKKVCTKCCTCPKTCTCTKTCSCPKKCKCECKPCKCGCKKCSCEPKHVVLKVKDCGCDDGRECDHCRYRRSCAENCDCKASGRKLKTVSLYKQGLVRTMRAVLNNPLGSDDEVLNSM